MMGIGEGGLTILNPPPHHLLIKNESWLFDLKTWVTNIKVGKLQF